MLAMLYGCMTKLDNYEKIKIKQQLKTRLKWKELACHHL